MHVATLQPLHQLLVQQIAAALLPASSWSSGRHAEHCFCPENHCFFAVNPLLCSAGQPTGVMCCFLCAEINLTMIPKTTGSSESSANMPTGSGESSASVLLAALFRGFPEERLPRQLRYGDLHAPRESVHCRLFDHTQDWSIIMQDRKIWWSTA